MDKALSVSELHKQYDYLMHSKKAADGKNKKSDSKTNFEVTVEGDFESIIFPKKLIHKNKGFLVGYMYDREYLTSSALTQDQSKARIYVKNIEKLQLDDYRFLLKKHVVLTGKVVVLPDAHRKGSCNPKELQIEVALGLAKNSIRILGDSEMAIKKREKWRKIPHKRRPLPSVPLAIAVLTTNGSHGSRDFSSIINSKAYKELEFFYLDKFELQNITDKVEDIVQKKIYNCLCIIRGGGPEHDLLVFNSPKLIECLENVKDEGIYLLTGIGHADDWTECDEVADYCAYTPTDAAYFLNGNCII